MKTVTMTSSNEQSTREILDMFGNFQTEDPTLRYVYDMFEIFAYNIWLEAGDSPEVVEVLVKIRDLCLDVSSKLH